MCGARNHLILSACGEKLCSLSLSAIPTQVIDAEKGFIPMDFGQDWSYVVEGNSVQFGLLNEFAWIVLDACEVGGWVGVHLTSLSYIMDTYMGG